MNCNDCRKLLSDLALGDLDAEPASRAQEHLSECPGCRSQSAALVRTAALLVRAPRLAASAQRRDDAVAAMVRAHDELTERQIGRRSRSWVPWATAAAFLLALATTLSVRTGATAFHVDQLSGRAELRDSATGRWRPVVAQVEVAVGDRLLTYPGCRLRLSAGPTELVLDEETSVEVLAPGRVTLDRGRLLAVSPDSGARPVVVTDPANNAVSVKGRTEVTLREVTGRALGWVETKGQTPDRPDPKTQIERSLVARVLSGEASLEGAREQRLCAMGGQEGRFTFGQPATVPMSGTSAGAWAESRPDGR